MSHCNTSFSDRSFNAVFNALFSAFNAAFSAFNAAFSAFNARTEHSIFWALITPRGLQASVYCCVRFLNSTNSYNTSVPTPNMIGCIYMSEISQGGKSSLFFSEYLMGLLHFCHIPFPAFTRTRNDFSRRRFGEGTHNKVNMVIRFLVN